MRLLFELVILYYVSMNSILMYSLRKIMEDSYVILNIVLD